MKVTNTKDKEFSKQYDEIVDVEDCYSVDEAREKYYRASVPNNVQTIHTIIINE